VLVGWLVGWLVFKKTKEVGGFGEVNECSVLMLLGGADESERAAVGGTGVDALWLGLVSWLIFLTS
jgi:hypothetical protein